MSTTGVAAVSNRPFTVAPSSIAGGGSVSPTRTSKVRVTGSACGDDLADAAVRDDVRVAGQADERFPDRAAAARSTWAGTSNTASRPSLRASVAIICPAWTTAPARGPTAVTTPGASASSWVKLTRSCGGLELRLRGVDLRLRRLQRLQRLIVVGAGGPALSEAACPGGRSGCWPGSALPAPRRSAASRGAQACSARSAARGGRRPVPPQPGRPASCEFSSRRPEMRKARLTSSLASTRPVIEIGVPDPGLFDGDGAHRTRLDDGRLLLLRPQALRANGARRIVAAKTVDRDLLPSSTTPTFHPRSIPLKPMESRRP